MRLERRFKRRKKAKNQFPPRWARKPKQGSLFGDPGPEYRRFRIPGLTPSAARQQLVLERGGTLPGAAEEIRPSPPFGWRQILGRMRGIKLAAWELLQDPEVHERLGKSDVAMLFQEALEGAPWQEVLRQARTMIREWDDREKAAALEAVGEVSDEEERRILAEEGVILGEEAPF